MDTEMRELNLPEAPKGHFWRVTTHHWLGDKPWVELRRKRWWGSTNVQAKWYTGDDFLNYVDEVEYLAKRILEDQEDAKRMHEGAKKYGGDYA